jgi:hypothetical protein
VTDTDLNRIEAGLGIALPKDYRELMRSRAEELKGLTHEIRGVTYGWFDDLLYLDADRCIDVNLSERQPNSGTGYAFPNWSNTFFLIGTNGAGDYYCLRLKDDRKVWMIGSDCGNEPSEMYPTLADFVNVQVRRHAEEPPWQPPPVLSSFDSSCPLLERFCFSIGRKVCQLECQDGDRPLTEEKLQLHGIDVRELGRCVLRIVAILAKCDPDALTIEVGPMPSSSGGLMLPFTEPPVGDPRFCSVGANIGRGNVYVALFGPQEKAPPPKEAGIDWQAFRTAVMALLQVIHPPGTQVTISEAQHSQFNVSERWYYDLTYSLQ